MRAKQFTTETALGTNPKREKRAGSRPDRGHEPQPRYVADRKTGKQYDPDEQFAKTMNSPEVMAQMKRMAAKEGVAEGHSDLGQVMQSIQSLDGQEVGHIYLQASEWKGTHSLSYDLTFRRMSAQEAFRYYNRDILKANSILQDAQRKLESAGIQTNMRLASLKSAIESDQASDENGDSDDGYSEYEQSLGGRLEFRLPEQNVAEGEIERQHGDLKPWAYWNSPERVAQKLYKIHGGEPIGKEEVKELWKVDGPDRMTKFMLKPDLHAILATYAQMSAQGSLLEGADERKQNALWAQITQHEKQAKATKNDIKKQHHMKMASDLRGQLKTRDDVNEHMAAMEAELEEHGKASRELCKSSKPDADLGASMLASCKSQGLRARDGNKSHKLGKTAKSRIKVGGHRIKGNKYGGPLPDWS